MKRPTWPGTDLTKSTNNYFSGHKDGTPSIHSKARRPIAKTEQEALARRHSGYYSRAGVK